MSRPRFDRLPAEKREMILESAAREFAAHGFENASMNKILEDAQLSKGAAYYYFDDKADLFATTVQHYAGDLIGGLEDSLGDLRAENFWATFADLYAAQFDFFYDRPWAFGAIKAAGKLSPSELEKHPALTASLGTIMEGLASVLQHGQQLGVVRTDLPEDLLSALFVGVDDASDRWILAHWETMNKEALLDIARRIIDALRRMVAP